LPPFINDRQPVADTSTPYLRARADAAPCRVSFSVRDALNLVEAGDSVAHVTRVVQRLLALFGERKRAGPSTFHSCHARPPFRVIENYFDGDAMALGDGLVPPRRQARGMPPAYWGNAHRGGVY
jgi:hypothetical protein